LAKFWPAKFKVYLEILKRNRRKMKHNYLRGIKVDDLQLSRCRFNAVNVNFITVGDESYFGSRTTIG